MPAFDKPTGLCHWQNCPDVAAPGSSYFCQEHFGQIQSEVVEDPPEAPREFTLQTKPSPVTITHNQVAAIPGLTIRDYYLAALLPEVMRRFSHGTEVTEKQLIDPLNSWLRFALSIREEE